MAVLTPVQVTRAGITVTTLTAASAGGDTFDNSSSPYMEFLNSSGSSITVNAAIYADGQTIVAGRSWVILAGARVRIQPNGATYNNPADNKVSLTYSGVTTFFVGIFIA